MTIAVQRIYEGARAGLATHFHALPPEDRRLRFGSSLSPEGVDAYVDGIDFDLDAVFAVHDDRLALIGVAHVAFGGRWRRLARRRPRVPAHACSGRTIPTRTRSSCATTIARRKPSWPPPRRSSTASIPMRKGWSRKRTWASWSSSGASTPKRRWPSTWRARSGVGTMPSQATLERVCRAVSHQPTERRDPGGLHRRRRCRTRCRRARSRCWSGRRSSTLLAYASLAVSQDDELALTDIVNVPPRQIGAASLQKIKRGHELISLESAEPAVGEEVRAAPGDGREHPRPHDAGVR